MEFNSGFKGLNTKGCLGNPTKCRSHSSSIQNTCHYKIIRFKLQPNGLTNLQ